MLQVLSRFVGFGAALAVVLLDISNGKKKKPILLINSKVKYELLRIKKTITSHDTRLYPFGLPSKEHALGLPIGQHVICMLISMRKSLNDLVFQYRVMMMRDL